MRLFFFFFSFWYCREMSAMEQTMCSFNWPKSMRIDVQYIRAKLVGDTSGKRNGGGNAIYSQTSPRQQQWLLQRCFIRAAGGVAVVIDGDSYFDTDTVATSIAAATAVYDRTLLSRALQLKAFSVGEPGHGTCN